MKKLFASIAILLLGTGSVLADEYPTEETVRYALDCMAEIGGQTDENLYTCICRYDAIRAAIPFPEYHDAVTFERNYKMTGEKGGSVRDNERGKGNYEKLKEARKTADSSCIVVKRIKLIKPTNKE